MSTDLQSSKGFTLIELVIVIIIIVVAAGMFAIRVPQYQEQAEKAAMQQVEGALQGALTLRYGTMMARGISDEKEIMSLKDGNPITWLQKAPVNYKGEFFEPTPQSVPPGSWLFDLKNRELIYVVDRSEHFNSGKDGNPWIRFRTRLEFEPQLGRPQSGVELTSAVFEPTEPYHWFD